MEALFGNFRLWVHENLHCSWNLIREDLQRRLSDKQALHEVAAVLGFTEVLPNWCRVMVGCYCGDENIDRL